MAAYPQSVAYTRMFLMVQSSDHLTALTGAAPTVNISKAGAAFGAAGGTVTEVANGFYKIVLTTTDTNTIGDLAFHITATSGDPTDFVDQVTDPVRGLGAPTALPNANAGASGGLLISGSNSGTTTFGALTCTGSFTISDGLLVSRSTANTAAITATGNGTGNGVTFTSGSGATGHGFACVAASTNGNGVSYTGNGSGDGMAPTGGATGRGIHAVGGATSGAGMRIEGSATSGNGIEVVTTSGDGVSILPTAGNGIIVTANGTSKHGIVATGGTAGTSDGIKGVAGTGGVDIRGNLTGNITGNLSGSAGSVTGAVGSVTGAVGSVTGAVGSVTGNVGGNVVGSVASVTAGVTVTTNNDKTGYTLSATGSAAFTEGYTTLATGSTYTLPAMLYDIHRALYARSVSGTTETILKVDGATAAHTITLNSSTAPTSAIQAT